LSLSKHRSGGTSLAPAQQTSPRLRSNSKIAAGSILERLTTPPPPPSVTPEPPPSRPGSRQSYLQKVMHGLVPMCGDDEPVFQTLYEKLGGEQTIITVVQKFYEKILADARVCYFFLDVNMTQQMNKQKLFLTLLFDGPHEYAGRGMHTAHARLVLEKGLRSQHFDIVRGHLESVLKEVHMSDDDVADANTRVGEWKDCILGTGSWA
jgi:hemoglobin